MGGEQMESNDAHVPTYRECFASLALGLAVFFLVVGIAATFFLVVNIAASFSVNGATFGGRNVFGPGALIVCIVLGIVIAAIFAGFQKLGFIFLGFIRQRRSAAED
jgi:hypothetical protein